MTSPAQQAEPATQIASTIGQLLAEASAATGDRGQADAEEIIAITEAMMRLLAGIPLRSDGKLTIKSLAAEAGLLRNKLTHKHTCMKDLFNALVKAQDMRPAIVADLHRDNRDLREQLVQVKAKRDALKTSNQRFARTIHVLELENEQLRASNKDSGNVHALHQRST